jgi:UDP-N-acetylglucosamine--N-acetylmuramyl-(pentapeptide) pyrophosphoryl-undecaprenol N-acetylglucosamine transferase
VTAALAVAAAFRAIHPDGDVLLVGRRGRIEERLVPAAGFPLKTIHVRGWDREARWKNAGLPAILPWALARGLRVVDQFRPDVALGVGAHAMVPCLLAARLRGVPYVLQVSEPSGLANRMLRSGAAAACVSFASDVGAFRTPRTVPTGYPVRDGFVRREPRVPPRRLLVMGGSLGARRINEAVWNALDWLLGRFEEVVHLTGAHGRRRGEELARPGYLPISQAADVAGLLARSDLVVARAGLGTCAELLAVGLPAILVPGRFGSGHQDHNAVRLERAGCAVRVPDAELDGGRLRSVIEALTPDDLRAMAGAAASMARPDAAREIVRVLDEVVSEARSRAGEGAVGEAVRESESLQLGTDFGDELSPEVGRPGEGGVSGLTGGDGIATLERPLGLEQRETGEMVEVLVGASHLLGAVEE